MDYLQYDMSQDTYYLFGGVFLVILALFGYSMSVFVCTKYKINFIFILELDRRSALSYVQIAEVASILLILLAFALGFTTSRWTEPHLDHRYMPSILFLTYLILLFLPFKIFYYKTRWWLIRHLGRLIFPVRRVAFADFFLADLMTSLTFFWASIYFGICYYMDGTLDDDKVVSVCAVKTSWVATLIITWALVVRVIQCLRKYYDDNYFHLHLKNTGKYALALITVYVSTFHAISKTSGSLALWIIMTLISSSCSFAWDIFIDWGIRRHECIFPKYVLYIVSFLDAILRFSWILTLSPSFIAGNPLLSFCLACLEICRRCMWTLFRVENEHSNNVEHYRAAKDIPPPPEDDSDIDVV